MANDFAEVAIVTDDKKQLEAHRCILSGKQVTSYIHNPSYIGGGPHSPLLADSGEWWRDVVRWMG